MSQAKHMEVNLVVKGEDAADQRLVYGEVYIPNVPDSDGEFMDAETIHKMAHDFMRKQLTKSIDIQHNNQLTDGVQVVESFIARKGDPDFVEGAWVLGVHINDDEVWGKVKKGEINGFSLEAYVTKSPSELTLNVPPMLQGKTSKAADHEHEFFASYDPVGNFLGGRTSIVNGHQHAIKRGTLTEQVDGHSHTFSFVELLNFQK